MKALWVILGTIHCQRKCQLKPPKHDYIAENVRFAGGLMQTALLMLAAAQGKLPL
jgi:hypothetical protein